MDPEKKSLNFIFPTKHVIPKSLKFSHWLSKKPSILGYHYFWKHPYIQINFNHPSTLDLPPNQDARGKWRFSSGIPDPKNGS